YPNGIWINNSMVPGSGDEWYFNTFYPDIGLYIYDIWATDASNNWNKSNPEMFIFHDTDGPRFGIPVVTPDPKEKGKDVNITIEVTDDIGIDEVWINITFPDGTWTNVSMIPGTGDIYYYNHTFDDIGNYTFTIWAVDIGGNWNQTDPGNFSVDPVEPIDVPVKPNKSLYMVLLFIYWPLFLILFTVLFVRRYGFGNRFKREIDPIGHVLHQYYKAVHPAALPNNIDTTQDIINFSLKTGIPIEEFIFALQAIRLEDQI
ncbi:MAG: hypothetical protein JSV09_09525, partial [Thermoplasmata archaeon]